MGGPHWFHSEFKTLLFVERDMTHWWLLKSIKQAIDLD